MMSRVSVLNRHLRDYDDKLFCGSGSFGAIDVMRKSYRFDMFSWNGNTYRYLRPSDHYIMSLTDTWNKQGRPVDWGIDPLINRIKAMDLWNNQTLVDDMLRSYDKNEVSKEREFSNSVESFLKDFRRQFARTFNDVNTGTLNKIDKRRLRDGNCKS